MSSLLSRAPAATAALPSTRPTSGTGSDDPGDRRTPVGLSLQLPEGEEAADQAEQHHGWLRDLLLDRDLDRRLHQQPVGSAEAQRCGVAGVDGPSMPSARPLPAKRRPLDRRDHRGTPRSRSTVAIVATASGPATTTLPDLAVSVMAGLDASASAVDRVPGGKPSHPMTWSPCRSSSS